LDITNTKKISEFVIRRMTTAAAAAAAAAMSKEELRRKKVLTQHRINTALGLLNLLSIVEEDSTTTRGVFTKKMMSEDPFFTQRLLFARRHADFITLPKMPVTN